ncbi:MAG: Ig-like domain-containing protein, partial [Candidatus Limnocylindria bacterium]
MPAVILPGTNVGAALNPPALAGRSASGPALSFPTFGSITVLFDQPVSGVHSGTFALRDARGQIVRADVTYDAETRRATLVPAKLLAPGSRYRVGLSESIRGATGSSLRWTSWSFVTGPQASEGTRFANGRDVRLA